jgi:hypothetical protein
LLKNLENALWFHNEDRFNKTFPKIPGRYLPFVFTLAFRFDCKFAFYKCASFFPRFLDVNFDVSPVMGECIRDVLSLLRAVTHPRARLLSQDLSAILRPPSAVLKNRDEVERNAKT